MEVLALGKIVGKSHNASPVPAAGSPMLWCAFLQWLGLARARNAIQMETPRLEAGPTGAQMTRNTFFRIL